MSSAARQSELFDKLVALAGGDIRVVQRALQSAPRANGRVSFRAVAEMIVRETRRSSERVAQAA